MEKLHCEILLTDNNLPETYMQFNSNVHNSINMEVLYYTYRKETWDSRQSLMYCQKPAYITLKNDKENFNSNPKCCSIIPCKNELGKLSKIIVETIKKTSEKSYIATNKEMHQTSSIASEIMPIKGIVYLFNLYWLVLPFNNEAPHVKSNPKR